MNEIQQAYLKGFTEKCAEHGVDPEAVAKTAARGQGMGVGGPAQQDGGASMCVCPSCGAQTEHVRGTPCAETKCPECGATMQGSVR